MERDKVKLIATDIDGTLLPEGTDKINPEIFQVILQLKKQGVVFAAASGRQFHSMAHLFTPVSNDMIFIAENGAYVSCRGQDMLLNVMERGAVERLVKQLREIPGACITLNAKDMFYVEHRDPKFLDLILHGYNNKVSQVEDVLAVDTPVVKVSLYLEKQIDQVAGELIPQWAEIFSGTVAGEIWLDFMKKGTNKGNALSTVQKALSIAPEETMVFGDNLNDVEMFRCAGRSYAVGNARAEVKAAARYVTDTHVNDGVLKVLRTLVEGN
ncbi:MAG: HAD family hydrolase [Lachnospiraceae bacterium]|nr:HAD family hydrolase [Lachnospiraceae bacterium]